MPYVGFMGGTFDPVHYGHLAVAEGARQLAGLDHVLFLPNRQPPHKAGPVVSAAEHRAAMVRLAIEGNPYFGLSDLELNREGPSYTIDTVRTLQAAHPGWELAFLAGMDSLMEIHTWHEYEALLRSIDLLVVARPGCSRERQEAVMASLGPELTRRIQILETPGVAVSSSELRRLGAGGYSLRYLVPDPVAWYIQKHRLYGGDPSGDMG